jgi:hypothetical protein
VTETSRLSKGVSAIESVSLLGRLTPQKKSKIKRKGKKAKEVATEENMVVSKSRGEQAELTH